MIVFDSFLCCIHLKLFGKIFGWTGTMVTIMTAYAAFLVASGRKTAGDNPANHMIFGNDLSTTDFYYYTGLVIGLLLIIAVFHVMLLCGIKYHKSILILPYVLFSVVFAASVVCILPSEIHLSSSNEHEATSPYLIIGCIIALIISIYLTLCVYSLYELIKYEEKRRRMYMNSDTILITPLSI